MHKLLGVASVMLISSPLVQASVPPIAPTSAAMSTSAPLTTIQQEAKPDVLTVATIQENCSDPMVRFTSTFCSN